MPEEPAPLLSSQIPGSAADSLTAGQLAAAVAMVTSRPGECSEFLLRLPGSASGA